MKKGIRALLPAVLAGLLLGGSMVRAETGRSIEELQRLLQESLTISEIDREVERLSKEEERLAAQLEETTLQIGQQAELAERMRERAGTVLRSYYMRDRQNLWLLLLHSDSFSGALNVFQYLQIVAENDRRSMDRYLAAREELLELETQLEERLAELADIKAAYENQRSRLLALQAELDRKLAEAEDREALIAVMEALHRQWQEDGLAYFQSFLFALGEALEALPDYVNAYPDSLAQNRLRVTFTVREEELNAFLQEKNELFREFAITLTETGVSISGSRGDLAIGIEGRFALTEQPDPSLRFLLERLRFNTFELPDTTIADLERRFPLVFSAKEHPLTAFLSLTDVEHRDGELVIHMTLGL